MGESELALSEKKNRVFKEANCWLYFLERSKFFLCQIRNVTDLAKSCFTYKPAAISCHLSCITALINSYSKDSRK